MNETIIAWAALGLLFILCLPLARVQRFLLTLYGVSLRLVMLALICGAAYLLVRPDRLPAQIADTVNNTYLLRNILPVPGSTFFVVCGVAWIAAVVLPLLAMIDAGSRPAVIRREVAAAQPVRVVTAPPVISNVQPPPAPQPQVPPPSRFGRRDAATVLAHAGSTR